MFRVEYPLLSPVLEDRPSGIDFELSQPKLGGSADSCFSGPREVDEMPCSQTMTKAPFSPRYASGARWLFRNDGETSTFSVDSCDLPTEEIFCSESFPLRFVRILEKTA
jgi:hypothetical protein